MAKNTAVKIDGQAATQNASKFSTSLINEGSCTWIPEDEADDYASTTTDTFTENGTYNAGEEYAGYSKVTVNVDKKLTEDTFYNNGTYRAADAEMNGYKKVTVAVPSNLGPLFVSENGTFQPGVDDEYDGWDSVSVNVTVLEDPETDTEINLDTTTGRVRITACDEEIEMDDEGMDIVIPDGDEYDPYGGVSFDDEGGIGSASIIDADGTLHVVDNEGNHSTKHYPAAFAITTPPNKLSYTAGEALSFTGIVCTIYDETGAVYTDTRYPDGTITLTDNELEFPVYIAPAPSGEEKTATSDISSIQTLVPLAYGSSVEWTNPSSWPHRRVTTNATEGCVITSTCGGYSNLYFINAKAEPDTHPFQSWTYAGKTVYYKVSAYAASQTPEGWNAIPCVVGGVGKEAAIAWTIVFGSKTGVTEIPVKWPSSAKSAEVRGHFGLGILYRDTYEIEVTAGE